MPPVSGLGYSVSSTATASPHVSCSISRNGSIEYVCLDKRALTERLNAFAAYPSIDIGRGMSRNGLSRSRSHSQSRSPKRMDNLDDLEEGTENSERDQTTVDKEIEEVEAELEIARLEAKLLKLRNSKAKSLAKSIIPSSSLSSIASIDNSNFALTTGIQVEGREKGRSSEYQASPDNHS